MFFPLHMAEMLQKMNRIILLSFAYFLKCLLLGVMVSPFASAQTAFITTPSKEPHPSIVYGMSILEETLNTLGWTVERRMGSTPDESQPKELEIVVAPFDVHKAADTPGADILRDVVSNEPESLSVSVYKRGEQYRAYAIGSDPAGTMYAALELAEQIKTGNPESSIPARINARRLTPSLTVRGVKCVLHRQALDDPSSWFHSETYWKGYLDQLACSRFNYLELHGIYDLVTTNYFNILPYFVYLPSFKTVGKSQKQADQNLQALRRIIRLAHERSINVSIINHHTSWDIQGKSVPMNDIKQLIQYNADAFKGLITACPDLDGFGFAIGENQNATEFYRQAYIQQVAKRKRPLILFLPTFLADRTQFMNLMDSYAGISVAQVKYNGDQLPVPYPVSGGRMQEWQSYSYQDYFNLPRKYNIIFDIATSGTHRVLTWGNVDFIRQTLVHIPAFGANGFVVEAPDTYYPHTDEYTSTIQHNLRYYTWTFERDWQWYMFWGRLGYNTQEPQKTFTQYFNHYFKSNVGLQIYQALQKSGHVIPTIAALYALGPDKRSLAPEMEIPSSFSEFFETQPFDTFKIRSVTEEAMRISTGEKDGRLSPFEMINHSVQQADEAVELMNEAGETLAQNVNQVENPTASNLVDRYREWNAWNHDFKALAALGKCYRGLINTALQVGIYQLTGDIPSVVIAIESLKSAQNAWEELAKETEARYQGLLEPLRMQTTSFHWRNYKPEFERDQAILSQIYNEWLEKGDLQPDRVHFQVHQSPPQKSILLTVCIPPNYQLDTLIADYRNSVGMTGRSEMKTTRLEGVYFTEIPARLAVEGRIEYYFHGAHDGKAFTIPDLSNSPPYKITVKEDQSPPQMIRLEHQRGISKNMVNVTGEFSDGSGVESVRLWWKAFPSHEAWSFKYMDRSGEMFQARFPITPEGAMYAVDVTDGLGHTAKYPDGDLAIPYRIVPPFNP